MDKWEYIVGVQLSRPMEKGDISLDERTIIDQHTAPEIWLNKKGIEGWELVAAIHRHDYTEFFLKRRMGTFDDPDHSVDEERFITIGYSSRSRLLVVSHTERGKTIRIINARRATAHERKRHEN